jgi:hypothetical protein
MLNLTEISITTRKLLVWLIIVFIGYLILKIISGIAIQYWKATHPPLLPPPNLRFDKIPSPKFTHVATSSSGFKFVLENVEGQPPETTSAGKVYSMPKKLPSLLSSERAKKFAAKLNFTDEPELVTSTLYRFFDPSDKLRTLEIDINDMNFKIKYDYTKNSQIFNHGQVMTRDQALTEVKNFLQLNSLFDETILKGKITVETLTFNPDSKVFNTVSSFSQANSVRINFFRNDLDELNILPPSFNQSYNYALFTASVPPYPRITEISYTFWPIELNDFATYPLKSGAVAWQDLLDGYALIVNVGRNSPDKIVIRKIYLAYYDSEEPQLYLQPIFVFEGDNDFVAYLPAIDSNYLK